MAVKRVLLGGQQVAIDDATGSLISRPEPGPATAYNPGSAINVTSARKQIAGANPARRMLTITNKSATAMLTIYLGPATDTFVSGSTAYVLAPEVDATHPGGTIDIPGWLHTGIVSGIMSAADATADNVGITET